MRRFCKKNLPSIFLCSTLTLFSSSNLSAQTFVASKTNLSPLFFKYFRQPLKANPQLNQIIKPSKYELMYWPNYPLTLQQIAARDRKNQQSIGEQIAGDIIGNAVNTLIYGKKTAIAAIPYF